MGNRTILLCSVLVLAAGLRPATAFDEDHEGKDKFEIKDLGVLPGFSQSRALAINNEGDIAGFSSAGPQMHAVLWSKEGRKILDLHPAGRATSSATAINKRGEVLVASGSPSKTFIWTRQTGLAEIVTPGFEFGGDGINNSARIVGASRPAGTGDFLSASMWTPETGMQVLRGSGLFGIVIGVNDRGEMAGWALGGLGPLAPTFAMRWSPQGVPQNLGALGGNQSQAFAINEHGDIVGSSRTGFGIQPGVSTHAFLWTPEAGMRDLGTIGTDTTLANGINGHRQVVGFTGSGRAFFWTEKKTGMQVLPALSTGFTQALAINDDGQIVGFSTAADGTQHAVLWTRSERGKD